MDELNTTYRDPEAHRYLDTHVQDRHHSFLMEHLLGEVFGLGPKDRVLEVGVGSGRYTETLLSRGCHVVATEPDPVMYDKLVVRMEDQRHVTPRLAGVSDLAGYCEGVSVLCGFHVLHHLDEQSFKVLQQTLELLTRESDSFRGWFFLEPNPLNPMYPIQIAFTPGISFLEEMGIWRLGRRRLLSTPSCPDVRLGDIGIFPPRRILERLPDWMLRWGTVLSKPKRPWNAYTVYGHLNAERFARLRVCAP